MHMVHHTRSPSTIPLGVGMLAEGVEGSVGVAVSEVEEEADLRQR